MSKMDNVPKNIDWSLLARQKLLLIKLTDAHPDLEGLLNLLDVFQDAAEADGHPVVWLGAEEEQS